MMAMAKRTQDPMRNFRKTGSFQYQNSTIEIWINTKTGQMLFFENGKPVEDPARQNELMNHFQSVNRKPA